MFSDSTSSINDLRLVACVIGDDTAPRFVSTIPACTSNINVLEFLFILAKQAGQSVVCKGDGWHVHKAKQVPMKHCGSVLIFSLFFYYRHKLIHAHAQASDLHEGVHKKPFINRWSRAAELTLHVFRKVGGGLDEERQRMNTCQVPNCMHLFTSLLIW